MRRGWARAGALGMALLAAAAPPLRAESAAQDSAAPESAAPQCLAVPAGDALRQLVAAAEPGSAFCLADGVHEGPLRIAAALSLRGGAAAVVRSAGAGSTIEVSADGVRLSGFSVDGSGARFDRLDAALRIRGDDVRVENLRIRGALFGILAEQCRGLQLLGNSVRGNPQKVLGLRGDGIRLWEVRGARVENNRLEDSRDLVVWYSPGNVFAGNQVRRGRYGTHFMYSHGNRVEANHYVDNVVGIFSMYSRGLQIRGNLIARSHGAAGVGIGAKESGGLAIVENWLLDNTVGIYLDNSPFDPARPNRIASNLLRFGESGVVFHGPSAGNRFFGNRFSDLHLSVSVEGRGTARDAEWRGNDFDDYAGYDFDGDGIGDVPYVLRTLEADLAARAPALRFFRGTPALALAEWIGRVAPIFQPSTLLEDPAPAMRLAPPPVPGTPDAG